MNAILRHLRHILRSTTGAIDLASIMVAVIVIGIVSGVILATTVAVVPWAQDNAARADLQTIKQAEGVYKVANLTYGNLTELQTPTSFALGGGGSHGLAPLSVAAPSGTAFLGPTTLETAVDANATGWVAVALRRNSPESPYRFCALRSRDVFESDCCYAKVG